MLGNLISQEEVFGEVALGRPESNHLACNDTVHAPALQTNEPLYVLEVFDVILGVQEHYAVLFTVWFSESISQSIAEVAPMMFSPGFRNHSLMRNSYFFTVGTDFAFEICNVNSIALQLPYASEINE